MTLIFTSYASAPDYTQPDEWLKRIEGYTGILEALSNKHKVIGIERISYEGDCIHNAVQYYFIQLKNRVVYFPWRLHGMMKNLQPDVIFINGFIFPLQIIQLRLKFGRRIKIIILHRGEKPYKGWRILLQRWADKCIDAYLFTSAEFGKEWTSNGNISRQNKIFEVIQASSIFFPSGKTAARSLLGIADATIFLWVGRLDANKDPLTVVKAFLQLLQFQPQAKLYMIYQEEELLPGIKNLISASNIATQAIHLIGAIPHRALQNWYNAADFIVSASHHEGSGVGVCEAMSCGCIPILTDIISFRKMTGPGKCGLLYEPGNEHSLLQALVKTTSFDMALEKQKTISQFKEQLSFEAIAGKINDMLFL
jgi:glycosyltransferase involved in cell wall biosynthesis